MSSATQTLPEGTRGQALAVGLLIVALGVLWLAVGAPLTGWYADRRQEIADQRGVLDHLARLAAALPTLRQAAVATGAATPASALLEGDSDAVAAAALQGIVQDLAATAGATLTSAETLPGEPRGTFRRIGVRVSMSATWPVLVVMLQALEDSRTRLLLDDLQLHASPRVGPSLVTSPTIEASFLVLGFRAGPAAARPSAADLRTDGARP